MSKDQTLFAPLFDQLAYDPGTGLFRWKVRKNGIHPDGIAGTVQKAGYVTIGVNGKTHLAHRLAWLFTFGEFPSQLIDHINGDRGDNRIGNLREASASQNGRNRKGKTNRHGLKGVTWLEKSKKWRASAQHLGTKKHIGLFETPEEAHQAYIAFVNRVEPGFCRV